jgi:hypothetical protein
MSARIHPVASMRVPMAKAARGRPVTHKTSGLRERAWWLMRTLPRFTLDELLFTLNDGAYRDAAGNLQKYIRALERVGVLVRLARRLPGRTLTSNGHVIWRLARDLGRQAPVWRAALQALWDPNSGTLIPLLPAPCAGGEAQP